MSLREKIEGLMGIQLSVGELENAPHMVLPWAVRRSEVLAAVEEWEWEQTQKGGGAHSPARTDQVRGDVTAPPVGTAGGVPAWYCPGCKLGVDLGETFGDCPKCGKPMEANTRVDAESTTGGDEFRPGLPPEQLRKVWPNWLDRDNGIGVVHFTEDRAYFDDGSDIDIRALAEMEDAEAFCPHGATWAHVEALAAKCD